MYICIAFETTTYFLLFFVPDIFLTPKKPKNSGGKPEIYGRMNRKISGENPKFIVKISG